ncbi:MASE3 domain-containing protein [Thermodesulfobacteriota bacterium]
MEKTSAAVNQRKPTDRSIIILFWTTSLLGLYFTSLHNYLLFHTLAEVFSIVVACGIFFVAWNSRRFLDNNYLFFLGMAYLFVGGLDLLHTSAYKGMGVFEGYGANLPTQLWIASRYLESLSLFIAPFLLNRKMRVNYIFFGYSALVVLLLVTIFYSSIFPECYVEGAGLTPFKKISEYIISLILLCSIIFLHQKKAHFDKAVFRYLVTSIVLTICAELTFTLYLSVYGLSNFIGHFLKILSFYFIYKAVIETGLSKPFNILFRDIKQSEEALRAEKTKLQEALKKVKTLSGLLPICSSCKKIRDDRGYWSQIESYIGKHSEAEFTHGICPDCAEKIYQDYSRNKVSENKEKHLVDDDKAQEEETISGRRYGVDRRMGSERRIRNLQDKILEINRVQERRTGSERRSGLERRSHPTSRYYHDRS